jgi:hypothetical protein
MCIYTDWLPLWLYTGSLAKDEVHLFEIKLDSHVICWTLMEIILYQKCMRYVTTVGSRKSCLVVLIVHEPDVGDKLL